MTTRLDVPTLRDLIPIADALDTVVAMSEEDGGECLSAAAALSLIVSDVRDAAAAAPGCVECRGRGWVDLPFQTSPDDVEMEERPCPVCRPWPHGFPGFRMGNSWRIPSYGPGESVATKRTVPPSPW